MVARSGVGVFLAALLFGAVFAVPSSTAAAEQLAQTSTEVQLRSFMAPVNPVNRRIKKEQPVTITLVVANNEHVFYVCELMPRLRDALLEALYYNPIPMSAQNIMDVSHVQPMLQQAANKALRRTLLLDLRVKQGVEQLVTGSSRSRASALGCGEVVEQEQKKRSAKESR